MIRRKNALQKLGWGLVVINKRFSRHMEYREEQLSKFRSRWSKVFLDLVAIGKKLRISSFMDLESRELEATPEIKERVFGAIFKFESIRCMRSTLSKNIVKNSRYFIDFENLNNIIKNDPDFGLY